MADVPVVLFVCVQNAGRSQMAEALLNANADGRILGRSAGSRPGKAVHPEVITVMEEVGLDLSGSRPKSLIEAGLDDVDVVVTMGCGDECPYIPGARVIDWEIPDPAERPLDEVRRIRDEIAGHVEELLRDLVSVTHR